MVVVDQVVAVVGQVVKVGEALVHSPGRDLMEVPIQAGVVEEVVTAIIRAVGAVQALL